MTDVILRVRTAGPHVSVQDAGRKGLMRFGVPASGPMDSKGLALANAALGNPVGHAGIEVSLGGLTLDCEQGALTVAVAGGGFVLQTGAEKLGSWQVLTLRAGQSLTLRRGPWGSWTYLAFAGDLSAESWLGSHATHAASGLGGGRIATGQSLRVQNARVLPAREGPIPCPVWARPRHLLRCVLGPQDRFFDAETLAHFNGAGFQTTDAFDRMGMRLRGLALIPSGALSIPSEPILRGAVQVSGDGVATVLLADHQTTGGYPKIATVLADDLDGFVQCRPREDIVFQVVTPDEAVQIARAAALRFARYLASRTAL